MAVNLAKSLAKAFKKFGKPIGVKPARLTILTPGARTSAAGGTNPTSTEYSCTAFIEQTNATYMRGTTAVSYDRLISILGGSLPAGVTPAPNSRITIVDVDKVERTFVVLGDIGPQGGAVGVAGDGVGAVFRCACRK